MDVPQTTFFLPAYAEFVLSFATRHSPLTWIDNAYLSRGIPSFDANLHRTLLRTKSTTSVIRSADLLPYLLPADEKVSTAVYLVKCPFNALCGTWMTSQLKSLHACDISPVDPALDQHMPLSIDQDDPTLSDHIGSGSKSSVSFSDRIIKEAFVGREEVLAQVTNRVKVSASHKRQERKDRLRAYISSARLELPVEEDPAYCAIFAKVTESEPMVDSDSGDELHQRTQQRRDKVLQRQAAARARQERKGGQASTSARSLASGPSYGRTSVITMVVHQFSSIIEVLHPNISLKEAKDEASQQLFKMLLGLAAHLQTCMAESGVMLCYGPASAYSPAVGLLSIFKNRLIRL